jgi:hypothetical protein
MHKHQYPIGKESPPACGPTVPPNLPDAAKPVIEVDMAQRTVVPTPYDVRGGCYPNECPSPFNPQK